MTGVPADAAYSIEVSRSVVEDEPADTVPANLVVDDQFAEVDGDPAPLPVAFGSPRPLLAAGRCRRLRRFDRIGGGTQIVFGNMSHAGGLAGRVRGEPGAPRSGRAAPMA